MRVAVDAMGGDHAPAEIVKGALAAVTRGLAAAFPERRRIRAGAEPPLSLEPADEAP